jgi:hypothetical protein
MKKNIKCIFFLKKRYVRFLYIHIFINNLLYIYVQLAKK